MRISLPRSLVIVVLLGLVAVAGGFLINPRALLLSYLATVVTLSAIAVGGLAVLMLTYLVRGAWTDSLHVPLVAASLTLPVAGLLFIPILIALPWLFPWAEEAVADAGTFKAIWLTPWFFVARTVLYFLIWTALAVWVRNAWGNPRRMIVSASAGLIVYALTASLAGVDWLESLTPKFHSSIYGLLFLTFQLLAGYSFALVVVLRVPDAPTFRYGPILISVLLMWAYNHAMQYIIIWAGNIPEEAVWYLRRESGGTGVLLWAVIILQFIAPFFALLLERVRNGRRPLLIIAALTLGLRLAEAYLLALPEGPTGGSALWLAIPGMLLLCGGIWLIVFAMAFNYLGQSARDLQPLPDFDQAGSPEPPKNPAHQAR